jgi:Protein of unknown function (DUF3500)
MTAQHQRRKPAHGLWAVACVSLFVQGAPVAAASTSAAAAALRLIETTAPGDRAQLQWSFDEQRRSDWHYTPRQRDGVAWKAMTPEQRLATTALLQSALNERGHDKVRALMALETTLRDLESSGSLRDPENYAIAIYGQPGAAAWGWRIEGHHLSLHFSLAGDRVVATLPQFFGANPAEVPRDVGRDPRPAAQRKGFRLLGTEEDLAREWLTSLTDTQRQQALFDKRSYGDIVSRNLPQAQPLDAVGLPFAQMDTAQQGQLLKLVGAFADHLQPELAQARLARVQSASMAALRFAWAGSTTPGQPHYFRIQGANFLIEFDNSGGNHIHAVWRDFDGDFGRDVLREHYRRAGPAARAASARP